MGVTAFFYAAEGDLDRVAAALRRCWPDELGALRDARREGGSAVDCIDGNDDGVELVLWQDGRFTGFAESELYLFEEAHLTRLSIELGTVIALCVAEHGGQYTFELYRHGELLRSLDNLEGARGAPLPEEAGVDLSKINLAEIEQLWSKFGLAHFFDGVPPFRVFCAAEPE